MDLLFAHSDYRFVRALPSLDPGEARHEVVHRWLDRRCEARVCTAGRGHWPHFLARTRAHGQLLHPGVIAPLSSGSLADERPYLILAGDGLRTLEDALESEITGLSVRQCVELLRDLLDVVVHLRKNGHAPPILALERLALRAGHWSPWELVLLTPFSTGAGAQRDSRFVVEAAGALLEEMLLRRSAAVSSDAPAFVQRLIRRSRMKGSDGFLSEEHFLRELEAHLRNEVEWSDKNLLLSAVGAVASSKDEFRQRSFEQVSNQSKILVERQAVLSLIHPHNGSAIVSSSDGLPQAGEVERNRQRERKFLLGLVLVLSSILAAIFTLFLAELLKSWI